MGILTPDRHLRLSHARESLNGEILAADSTVLEYIQGRATELTGDDLTRVVMQAFTME